MEVAKQIPFFEALKIALDGRTQRWLSEKTGIQESEISRITSGRLIPTQDQIEKIKKIFPTELSSY